MSKHGAVTIECPKCGLKFDCSVEQGVEVHCPTCGEFIAIMGPKAEGKS